MNKLMIAAVAAVMAGGAFAAPLVYDYKATVKHMYLKQKPVTAYDGNDYILYLKVVRSASLKGYLVMDQDGVTSPTINAATAAACYDQGRSRGFLVVQNEDAAPEFRTPKIMPAVLDAKWIDQRYDHATMPETGLAEGVLFVGGETIGAIRPHLDNLGTKYADVAERATEVPAPANPAANTPGLVAYADYLWTSVYLFGQFNGPNWYDDGTGPFDDFETAWELNLPAGLQIGFAYFHPYFHDTWMNGAGFGTYTIPSQTTGNLCCGLKTVTTSTIVLDTLKGAVKGGLFLCTENAVDAVSDTYKFFDLPTGTTPYTTSSIQLHRWEDQFNTTRIYDSTSSFGNDKWQNDLWQDGAVETETTDVISGEWKIKYNPKFWLKDGVYVGLTADERTALGITSTVAKDNQNLLAGALKSAALRLNSSAIFCDKLLKGNTSYELSDIDEDDFASLVNGQKILPVITPKFAAFYGIAY